MALKKTRFLRFLKTPKNLKTPKFRFLGIFIFWSNFIQIIFHILIMICEFCYIVQNMV